MTGMNDIAYEDVEGAPRTALSHSGHELIGWKVEAIIYAPTIEAAQSRLRAADIYLDHARVLDDYDGAPVYGGVSDPAETSQVRVLPGLHWESAQHDQEPGDQKADQSVFDHGYWDLGPTSHGEWSVTLVRQDESLDILREWTWRGRDEARVKEIAAYIEFGIRQLKIVCSGGTPAATALLISDWLESARLLHS